MPIIQKLNAKITNNGNPPEKSHETKLLSSDLIGKNSKSIGLTTSPSIAQTSILAVLPSSISITVCNDHMLSPANKSP